MPRTSASPLRRSHSSALSAAACARGLHQSQSGLLLAVGSFETVSRCLAPSMGASQSGRPRSAACLPAPGMTGASAVLQPASGRQGARPAARRGVGKVFGGAGGYGHALGEYTSGRAAGGHEGDGRGQWKRPFEFPIPPAAISTPCTTAAKVSVSLVKVIAIAYASLSRGYKYTHPAW
jgi:hypothetical protein